MSRAEFTVEQGGRYEQQQARRKAHGPKEAVSAQAVCGCVGRALATCATQHYPGSARLGWKRTSGVRHSGVCGDGAKPGAATRSRRKSDLVRTLTQAGQHQQEVMPMAYRRGTKVGAGNQYHVYAGDRHRVSREIADLADRRTRPFFDHAGIDRPLSILMQEAYLQGIKDAVQAMEAKTNLNSNN